MEDLSGKNILILGMGHRTTPPLVQVLKDLGAHIFLNDQKKKEELKETIQALSGVDYHLHTGDHQISLDHIHTIIVNPAVLLDNPVLMEAQEKGIPFMGELELAYRLCRAPMIAITGTNGKTTTTHLVGELLQTGERQVVVGGNIGKALIGLVDGLTVDDLVVAEVSSFQLSTIQDFRPFCGVLLNIAPDHLDYHGSMEAYQDTKKRLFSNQGPEDLALLNGDEPLFLSWAEEIPGETFFFSTKGEVPQGGFFQEHRLITRLDHEEEILSLKELPPVGYFNRENILAAVVVARLWGIERERIREILFSFQGLEHRLEQVAIRDGVIYYNSSKATNPHSTLWDLKYMKGPLILILGGQKRGIDFSVLYGAVIEKASLVLLLGETAQELEEGFQKRGFHALQRVLDLEEGVYQAATAAKKGTTVLLSPAAPSWDMFSSYQERGETFKYLVNRLKEG